jgi:hypothetical protein
LGLLASVRLKNLQSSQKEGGSEIRVMMNKECDKLDLGKSHAIFRVLRPSLASTELSRFAMSVSAMIWSNSSFYCGKIKQKIKTKTEYTKRRINESIS